MTESQKPGPADVSKDDPGRFGFSIMVIALALYGIERFLAFSFLQSRSLHAGVLESWIMEFCFGQPPYSLLNILLGFDSNQGLFGFIAPTRLLAVTIQIAHFGLNYWIARFPFVLADKRAKHKTG